MGGCYFFLEETGKIKILLIFSNFNNKKSYDIIINAWKVILIGKEPVLKTGVARLQSSNLWSSARFDGEVAEWPNALPC